jgi:hypothetical protein
VFARYVGVLGAGGAAEEIPERIAYAVLTAQWAIGLILMLSAFALLGWLASILVPDVGTWWRRDGALPPGD